VDSAAKGQIFEPQPEKKWINEGGEKGEKMMAKPVPEPVFLIHY